MTRTSTSRRSGGTSRRAAATAGPTTLKSGREAAALFRRLFPNVNNKRKRGWKFRPEVGYQACNELRSRSGEALPHDKRVHNALSLNAAANARAMEGAAAAASSGGDRIGPGSFFLYDPAELNKAASGGFSDALSRALTVVNTRAAADQLVLRGFVLFTTLNQYDTVTTGFSNLPFPTAQASAARAAETPLHQVAPPQGEVLALPKRMPPLHTGDSSTMEKVIECFEVKVVDEGSNCIWHPIRMWSRNSKERKNLGYCDGSNLNNRLAAYYAIKCGKTDVSTLQGMSFSKLVQTGRTSKDGDGTLFDACIALHAPNHSTNGTDGTSSRGT